MGIAVIAVLVCSNIIIAALRKIIPGEIRMPCFIVIAASFVTMVDLTMQAFAPPAINRALGIFIPLIVVNCVILFRAEAFASKNTVSHSIADGLGMGIGYGLALLLVSSVRELLGDGSFWGYKVSLSYAPASIMLLAPGAFLTLGLTLGFFNYIRLRGAAAAESAAQEKQCGCAGCASGACGAK